MVPRFPIANFGLRIVDEELAAARGRAAPQPILWWLGGVVCAVAIGWLAARIHSSGHAPVGLVSIGVGTLLGFAIFRLAAMLRIAGNHVLIVGALLFALFTIIAEHAWLYHDFRGQWHEARERSATVAMFRPESPPTAREYFAREWNAVLWLSDAAMIVASALAVVVARGGRRLSRAAGAKDAAIDPHVANNANSSPDS